MDKARDLGTARKKFQKLKEPISVSSFIDKSFTINDLAFLAIAGVTSLFLFTIAGGVGFVPFGVYLLEKIKKPQSLDSKIVGNQLGTAKKEFDDAFSRQTSSAATVS